MTNRKMRIYDISPRLDASIAVWPGDVPLRREASMEMAGGAHLELSSMHSTVHLGAHADAPCHFALGAPSIGEVSLEPYLGPCRVIEMCPRPTDGLIRLEHCPGLAEAQEPRILFKTNSFPDPHTFSEDFCAFAPELISYLAKKKVLLIGIDTPSIDVFSSKDLPSHQEILRTQMRNLEGLDLSGVAPGIYELIALPLRLMGFDASPVRAILRA